MGSDDLLRRIQELETELADLKHTTQPDTNPTLTLDIHGVILEIMGSWFGGVFPDCVGRSLGTLFDPQGRDVLQGVIRVRFAGASELRLRTLDGRWVGLIVSPLAGRGRGAWRLVLTDLTRHEILSRASTSRRQAQAMSTLAGGLAGELIDPMSIVQGRLELLLELGVTELKAAERHLSVALEHARRISTSLRNLRMVGRGALNQLREVSLSEIAGEALELLGPWRSRVVVELRPADLTVGGDVPQIARVLTSLLRLSLEGAGRSSVLLSGRRGQDEIVVGIGPLGRPRGSLDPARAGLAFERSLLERLGGQLQAWSGGNDVHFELSLCRAPTLRRRPRTIDHTLLLVGASSFRDAVRLSLDKDGFHFIDGEDGDAAMEVIERNPSVDAVITDLVLPSGPSGLALADALSAEAPERDLRILVVGLSGAELPPQDLGAGVVPVRWPPRRVELLEALGRRVRRA